MRMQTASKKVVNGWAMYDWANSVYNLVITSTIFPAYYEAVTGDGNENTLIDKIKIGNWKFWFKQGQQNDQGAQLNWNWDWI